MINNVTTNPCSTTANVNFRRTLYLQNPAQGIYYGSVAQLDDGGTGNYHGLILSVQHRSARGYSIQANYTWSHCVSDLADPELAVAGANFTIPNNRHYDRSNCPFTDRRQLFNLSAVFEVPRFSNPTTRLLASGWQFSPIVKAETGPFMTMLSGLDQALTGQGAYERAVQVLADPYTPNRSASSYLNPAAFTQPALGTYSTLGASNIVAPGALYFNSALSRTFKIRDRESLQVRFEGFNIVNRANLGPPNGLSGNGTAASTSGFITPTAAINSPTFGKILSSDDPRILQGALKFVF